MSHANLTFAEALVGTLVAAGVRFWWAPGARSAPLAAALARLGVPTIVHGDERGLAFAALGSARVEGRLQAVVTTSGSAVANLLPAAVEAAASGVPLLLLTADRPPELHRSGAPQTWRQALLLAGAVREVLEAPLPREAPTAARHGAALARRLLTLAWGPPPGPIQANLPFAEPLLPAGSASPPSGAEVPPPAAPATLLPPEAQLAAAAARMRGRAGWILCGTFDPDPRLEAALVALSDRTGWPLLAAATAGGLRSDHPDRVLAHADLWAPFAPDPEVVVHVGAWPAARPLVRKLRAARPTWIHVGWRTDEVNPEAWPGSWLRGSPAATVTALAELVDPPTVAASLVAGLERICVHLLADVDASSEPTLPAAIRYLWRAAPPGTRFLVASGLTIRDLDAWGGHPTSGVRGYANRGLNGIDGLVATAAGCALATRSRTVALLGDGALRHDLGSLLLVAATRPDLTLVVLDDGGGGIFWELPELARDVELCRRFFYAPAPGDPVAAARAAGLAAERVTDLEALGAAVFAEASGPRLVHLAVPLERNRAWRRHLRTRIATELGRRSPATPVAGALGPHATGEARPHQRTQRSIHDEPAR